MPANYTITCNIILISCGAPKVLFREKGAAGGRLTSPTVKVVCNEEVYRAVRATVPACATAIETRARSMQTNLEKIFPIGFIRLES